MTIVCPACLTPIGDEATLDCSRETGTLVCSRCGAEVTPEPPTSSYQKLQERVTRDRVGNFALVRLLGQGGFGSVWLAEDRTLGRQVALKLPKSSTNDTQLLREAKTAAKLRHPNIVAIYEVGIDNGQVFIASEFVDGDDLRTELAAGRPKIARAVTLVTTLARAIQHAHEHGVVHRDLKPANIVINSAGEPSITDFGIAKHLAVDETISTEGAVIGTVSYMSPEQASGNSRETDHRADIYSLGVMLFEMLTEYRPFRGNARAVIHQKVSEDPPSPRKLVPGLPKDLETICLKCLERVPGKRYASAAELADELERFAQGIPIRARPVSKGEKLWRWGRRNPAIAALALSLFVSLFAGLVSVSYFWQRAVASATKTRAALYRANMHLASKLWDRGDVAGLRQTLDNYRSEPAATGLRGFEWRYFDLLTQPFVQLALHGDAVTDVAVSGKGDLFASTGNDNAIRIWNSGDGELVRTLLARAGRTESIDFSPTDGRLLSGHADGVIRLWNPAQHDHTVREFQHAGVTHVCFSPDGKHLASAARDGSVRYWQVNAEEPLAQWSAERRGTATLRFSPDGGQIAIATENGTIALWDPASSEAPRQWNSRTQYLCLAYLDGGRTLATGSLSGQLQFWSVESGERTNLLSLGGGAIGDLEYLSDSDLLAVTETNGQLTLFNGQQQPVRTLVTHALTHGMLAQSADGSVIAAGSGDGSVKLLQTASLLRPDVLWHDTHVRALAFVGQDTVAACAGDGAIFLWDLSTGERRELVAATDREMLTIALQPRSQRLAAAGMFREISLLPLDSSNAEAIDLPAAGVASVSFSNDGRWLACGARNGTVRCFATPSKEPTCELTFPDVQVNEVIFTKDNLLVAAYSDGRVVFVQPANGSQVGSPLDVGANALALASCAGGEWLAVGTAAGDLHFFDLASRKLIRVVKAHSSRINDLAVLAGGERLVSGGRDKELRIWEVATGDFISSLTGHGRQVFAIAVSPDGDTIVSAGLAGDIRLWRSVAPN